MNLARLDMDGGSPAAAEAEIRTAIQRWPYFQPAWVNLADVLRVQGRDPDGEQVLRRALKTDDQNAAAHHALGLLLVRRRQVPEAVSEFERAAAVAPENPVRVCLRRGAEQRRPPDDALKSCAPPTSDSPEQSLLKPWPRSAATRAHGTTPVVGRRSPS
jgi:tetratricopeptide (TPR) repeat protein